MPNRIIKESICTSSTIDQLTAEEERFFYRLIVNCDDYGRLDARITILRAKLFPLKLDQIKDKDVEKLINKLALVGLVIIYECDGQPYLQLTTWEKHQTIRNHKSKYPNPSDSNCIQLKSIDRKSPRNPIQSESNPNPYTGVAKETIPILKSKIKYAENVTMTEEEHQKLIDKFGESGAKDRIENLNLYKGSKGKKYDSDYMTILAWERKNEKEKPKGSSQYIQPPPPPESDWKYPDWYGKDES